VKRKAGLPVTCRVDGLTGRLREARQSPSPNFDARPAGMRPELIVVHGISLPPGRFGGPWIDRLFRNDLPPDAHPYFEQIAGLRVSAHVLIRRRGGLVQYVSFNDRAWHAGRSSYQGRPACNDFSIGIELEGSDDRPYAPAQYARLAAVIGSLCRVYPTLDARRVVGHSDIAPGRKTDPGPVFDWPLLRSMLGVQAL